MEHSDKATDSIYYPDIRFGVVGNILTELVVSITQMSDLEL